MKFSIKNVTLCLKTVTYKEIRRFSSKIAVQVDEGVLKKLENNELNPRQHPGVFKNNRVDLPLRIQKALMKVVGDYPEKKILDDCKKLNAILSSRHPPPEQNELDNKMAKIMDEVNKLMPQEKFLALNEVEQIKWENRKKNLLQNRFKQRTFAWKPINYGHYESIVYALGRGSLEYTVLMRILKEINSRDINFKPQSFIDFGSGVGTAMWAASTMWKDSIVEYFNVDISRDMNDLSELIIRDGNENQHMTLNNVFYRQFLPAIETKYNLVFCSFSLFELESYQNRLEVIMNLWKKCDGYMVIVEQGSRRGFQLVNEAKDFILSQEDHDLLGHVFAPCPHDNKCPRIANLEDATPCNFEINYGPFCFTNGQSHKAATERYSYVVLKKGIPDDVTREWPRLVRPTLVRSKHSICRMCTSEGKLAEVIFTKSKHGISAYRCARSSRWGDRLPIVIAEAEAKHDS